MGDRVDELDDLLPAHCANAYLDTWDRHLSIAFSNTKGLRNAPGENNCFVNCAVQVFWHLDVFRRSYRRLSGHTCMGNSCIFCALKVIFTQFQYSDKASLHPEALRKALAETFANQQRFQLGHMDDAAECFENILRRLHFHVAGSFNEDTCTAPHCLPHQKFSMAVQEKVMCVCGASTSPLKFHEMVHYVSASALLAQSRLDHGKEGVTPTDRFGLLLRRASAMGDVRNCPANCGKQVQKQRTLLNIPDVVSVGLVWDSDRPSVETTTEVARILGTSILLPDMYHQVMTDPNHLPLLQLVAVVCYYGKHYSTFVFHSKLKTWIYFDDATVREIGPLWTNVVDKCSRGRFQPLLLLYANDSAIPIPVDTAPQRRVMAAGYVPAGPPESSESRLDRTQDSIKSLTTSSRHSTPNPDHPSQQYISQAPPAPLYPHDTGRDSPARLTKDHVRQPSFLTAMSKDRTKPGDTAEGGGMLPGGAAYKPGSRRQLLDGGANCGRLDTMVEEGRDYPDYTLSSGDQYRRPSPLGVESKKPLPMPPNASRIMEDQRKSAWKKTACGKDRGGADVVRYQVDPSRSHRGTPDFTKQPCDQGIPAQAGGPGPFRTAAHPGTERCVSSREERGGRMWVGGQHVVVKPTPTAHAQQGSGDCSSHSAVQSGLATLPRHRGHSHHKEPPAHHQPGSTHGEVAQLSHRSAHSGTPRDCPLPPGTPPPEYNTVISDPHPSHSRQASTSSQASSMRSSVSMGNLHQLGSGKLSESQQTRPVRNDKQSCSEVHQRPEKGKTLKKSDSESEALTQKSQQYIDRRMVETILKHQGLHRHGSSCSNSSVESDSVVGRLMAKQSALKVDIPLDTLSLSSLKDSGCGSSDRHSSSSTGSGSVEQFPACFFTKSMIVPRSVNTPHHMLDQPNPQGQPDRTSPRSSQAGGAREGSSKGMQPIQESSQEEGLKTSPTEPLGTRKFILASPPPHPAEPRPPPIPPKNFAQFQIIKSSHGQLPTPHERESSLESLIKEENVSSNFVSLCKKADVLMDRCVMAETKQDVPSALHSGEEALGCLKEAMTHKELNSKARAYLQKKHNTCLLKVHSLQKRAPASRQESHSSGIGSDITSSVGNSRSSITSSDSDLSDQVLKLSRQPGRPGVSPVSRPPLAPHPSPAPVSDKARDMCAQGTVRVTQGQTVDAQNYHRNSVSKTDNQNGGHGNAAYGGQRGGNQVQPSRQNHSRTDSHNSNHPAQFHGRTDSTASASVPPSHVSDYVSVNSLTGADSTADLYGTLPRNKSRKPGSETAASAEMYQSFLNKQKSLQAEVTSSQQSLDSVRSDAGSDAGSRMNKTQIRQLLQDSIVQRQWHQPSSAHTPGQQSTAGHHTPSQQEHRPADQPCPRPGSSSGAYRPPPQPAQTAPQQHPTYVRQPAPSTSQHRPRQSPPAGYQHSQSTGQTSQAAVPVPAPRAPLPGSMSTARPRTPTCQPSAGTGCSNPATHQNPALSYSSSGAAKSSLAQNVARVAPYSHLVDGQPMRCSGSSYLVMMHPSQQNTPSSATHGSQGYPPPASPHPLPPASKPLPRSASQSDCRAVGNGAHSANMSDQGASLSNIMCKKPNSASLSVANCSEHPHTAGSHQSCDGAHTEAARPPSTVRSLLSRFERTDVTAGQAPCPRSGPGQPQSAQKGGPGDRAAKRFSLGRTRSKSESSSTRPKSVLKKSRLKSRPRKSVTFAESIAHFADCEDANSGYESATELSCSQLAVDSRLNCSEEDVRLRQQGRHSDCELSDSSSSSGDECNVEEDEVCHLCHRRRSSSGQAFCAKCSFYLAKLNLS